MGSIKPTHIVEYRAIEDLHELEGNPRIIKKEQFEKLKQSIKDNADYFEARPLILSNRTGKLVILAGNQRFKAAKAIGLTEVPSVLLENLTEEREKEIIIRDNVENGEWDYGILANEWETEDLNDWGVDVPVASGLIDDIKGEKFPDKEMWFKKVPFLVIFYDADSLARLEELLGRSIETDTLDARDL